MRTEPCTDKRIVRMVQHLGMSYSRRTDCPECGAERSALVSRKGHNHGYVHCFRASCQYSAPVHLELSMSELIRLRTEDALRNPSALTYDLPKDCVPANSLLGAECTGLHELWLWLGKAGLRAEDVQNWVQWSESMQSAVIPCVAQGYNVGVLYRPLPSRRGVPKYILKHRTGTGAIWAPGGMFPHPGRNVHVVEDALSCIRLFLLGVPVVASLGTHCNDSIMAGLLDLRPASVTLFLDGDRAGARGTSIFKRKMDLHGIQHAQITLQDRDPKDCTNEELRMLTNKEWLESQVTKERS